LGKRKLGAITKAAKGGQVDLRDSNLHGKKAKEKST